MKKMVLLYHFSQDRLQGIRRSLLPLRVLAREVSPEDYAQPIGALVEAEGFQRTEAAAAETFDEEMLVMYGFNSADLDIFLKMLRKNGVGRIALKAVVTKTNIHWSSTELYRAVRADHEAMQHQQKS